MQRYRYIKKVPRTARIPILPFVSVGIGALLFFWAVTPIVSFKLFFQPQSPVVTPLTEESIAYAAEVGTDLTKMSNWIGSSQSESVVTPVTSYKLTIPKLKIKDALVRIGSDDLSKNLIHWGGTGLPGKPGRGVVFGHSMLPQFFNPKNYLSIFSLLPKLEKGDDIFVTFDGVTYHYVVSSSRVTTPEDISGLDQVYDDSYLTFVTCVPPGTYEKRLWLTTKLVSIGTAQL